MEPEAYIHSGFDIVIAGWAGLYGTAEIIKKNRDKLLKRYPESFLLKIDILAASCQKCKETGRANNPGQEVSFGKDVYICPATEDGVLGALYKMHKDLGLGTDVDIFRIPVRQETIEICEFYDLDPYRLCSFGCFCISCSDGNALCRELESRSIEAALAGKIVSDHACILRKKENVQYVTPPKREKAQADKYHKLI